jgi:nondiscriminating glutamyl-tRNA synthetase
MSVERETTGPVRTRFAPSPSGYLHIGGARTALFNWLFARGRGGQFILRIDDTDAARSSDESIQGIVDGMEWLGLDWDEGPRVGGPHAPYYQSERKALYAAALKRLVDQGRAYWCYCTPEELEAERAAALRAKRPQVYSGRCRDLTEAQQAAFRAEGRRPAARLKVEPGLITVRDLIRGSVSVEAETIGDWVLVRPNGAPIYNFASVVDDAAMGITHIIRAVEHLANTPKQIRLFEALGAPLPAFAHVSLVLAEGGREKLSKRHGAVAVQEFRDHGYLPEAMVNYLVRLGWSYDDQREIFSIDELKRYFALDRVNPSGASWDSKKLLWINGEYVKALPAEERARRCAPFLEKAGLVKGPLDAEALGRLVAIVEALGDRLRTFEDIVEHAACFYTEDYAYDPEGVSKRLRGAHVPALLAQLKALLAQQEPFTVEVIEAAVRALAERAGLKPGEVFHPLRMALTGKTAGAGLFEIVALLGRQRAVERIDRTLRLLAEGAL